MGTKRISELSPALRYLVTAGVALLAASCVPRQNSALERAGISVENAKSNPDLMEYAPRIVSEAEGLYRKANHEWRARGDSAEVDHLIYMTQRKLDLAREDTNRRMSLELASLQRDSAHRRAVDISALDARRRQELRHNAMEAVQIRSMARENEQLVFELRQEVAALQARETERGLELQFSENALFDSNGSRLIPEAAQRLAPVIAFVRAHPYATVAIESHTDNQGANDYNQHLSERQADAVRRHFIAEGLSFRRVGGRGHGAQDPIASNTTAAGRQQNRRVEVVISSHG